MCTVATLNALVLVLTIAIALTARATENPTPNSAVARGGERSNGVGSNAVLPGSGLPRLPVTGTELVPGGGLPSTAKNVCGAFQKYKSCHRSRR
ncbi:hypothetical protein MTO96_036733, partial [Rhipicephalus appendiculatus]